MQIDCAVNGYVCPMKKTNYITRLTIDLLTKNEEARDDMMLCVRYIHDFEMALFGIKKTEYYDALFNGRISSINTLDRVWRRVQLDNESLRGKEWLERQVQAGLISASAIKSNSLRLFEL